MKINDKVYGEVEVFEPVILDLIECHSMQRLKGIDQGGFSQEFFSVKTCTRFDHSVGVFLLLKRYNAPLEEQIAGLIHDVSHSAFSHTIDFVLEEGSQKEQSHQDNIFSQYVRGSEIPKILKKYNVDLDYILEEKNFPLKENELPDLCADRIDYSLREGVSYNILQKEESDYLLKNLRVQDNKWIFNDFKSAKKFSDNFFTLNKNFWSGIRTALMFTTLSDYFKYALKKKYVTKKDFYTTDQQVLDAIAKHLHSDKQLSLLFQRLTHKVPHRNDYKKGKRTFIKSRCVDPLCEYEGSIKRISEIDFHWAKVVKQESKPKEYHIVFEEE